MDEEQLKKDEIVVTAQRVKYRCVEYHEGYVTIEQNFTRRRVPKGYYFEDNGVEIYVSTLYSDIFQHQKKMRRFVVNKVTKEWREFVGVLVENFRPDKIDPVASNVIEELKDGRPKTSGRG